MSLTRGGQHFRGSEQKLKVKSISYVFSNIYATCFMWAFWTQELYSMVVDSVVCKYGPLRLSRTPYTSSLTLL